MSGEPRVPAPTGRLRPLAAGSASSGSGSGRREPAAASIALGDTGSFGGTVANLSAVPACSKRPGPAVGDSGLALRAERVQHVGPSGSHLAAAGRRRTGGL